MGFSQRGEGAKGGGVREASPRGLSGGLFQAELIRAVQLLILVGVRPFLHQFQSYKVSCNS